MPTINVSTINQTDLQVLVVDDSAMVRQVMQAIMSTDRRIHVKTAADPLIAWAKMQKEPPHVVITDLEMPRMDGLTFIRKIMAEMPTPSWSVQVSPLPEPNSRFAPWKKAQSRSSPNPKSECASFYTNRQSR